MAQLASARPKVLVMEWKLATHEGHYHTQITALNTLFPRHDLLLVAGHKYDGFAGDAVAKIGQKNNKLARLRAKIVHGTLVQKCSGLIGSMKARRLSLPFSAYGRELLAIFHDVGMNENDIVIVPTAEIASLESAVEFTGALGARAPKIALRFLGPEFGEPKHNLRSARLRALSAKITPNIFLFTETEELAFLLRSDYGLNAHGGCFLTCSIDADEPPIKNNEKGGRFKIGVFGAPRHEKGSHRIGDILNILADEMALTAQRRKVEFLIQGSQADFGSDGILAALRPFLNEQGAIQVTPVGDLLPPDEFAHYFASADAILIPYDINIYGVQGSGIVQDAVSAFKPVIYSDGMSMKNFLIHGNALAATTDAEFARAIHHMVISPSQFFKGTAFAAKYYRDITRSSPLLELVAN